MVEGGFKVKHYHLDEYFFDIDSKKLFIRGWAFLPSCEIIVELDKKEVLRARPNEYRVDICQRYTDQKDKSNYGFEYTIPVEKQYKNIKISAFVDGKKYKIFSSRIPTTTLEKGANRIYHLAGKSMRVIKKQNVKLLNPKLIHRYVSSVVENRQYRKEGQYYVNPNNSFQYRTWALEKEKREQEPYKEMEYQPLISILVPVYNVPTVYLKACIESVLEQTYPNFELCIADDCSTDPEIKRVLDAYKEKDERIKVVYRKKNGHISRATNSALEIATGDFIALLDNDDVLTKDALYQVVKALNQNPKLDLIYSDEDKMDLNGNLCFPTYKPDWSPELFFCYNYLCHFTTIRRSIMDKIHGFRVGYEGAQDYDLFLRVVAATKDKNIYHIPKILYHWRMIPGSTAAIMSNKSYAFDRGKKALQDYFDKKKIACHVSRVPKFPYYYPKYKVSRTNMITVIITGNDKKAKRCQEQLEKFTDYKRMEILLANGESFDELVAKAKGKYIVVMDATTQLQKESSIYSLIQFAAVDHVGVVSPSIRKRNSYFKSSGVILFKDHFKHVLYSGRQKITAVEPKLKIPVNYSVPGTKVMAFDKEKYLKVNRKLKIDGIPTEIDWIKICLNFIKEGYYNVCDSSNEYVCSGNLELPYDQEAYQALKVKQDPFYNPNYSKTYMFKLDKLEETTDEK